MNRIEVKFGTLQTLCSAIFVNMCVLLQDSVFMTNRVIPINIFVIPSRARNLVEM